MTGVNVLVYVYRIATLVVVAIAALASLLLAPAVGGIQHEAAVLPPNVDRQLESTTSTATSKPRRARKVEYMLRTKITSPESHVVLFLCLSSYVTVGDYCYL